MGVVSVQVRARLALPWGGGRAAGRKGQLEPGPDEWAGTGQAEQAGTAFQGQEQHVAICAGGKEAREVEEWHRGGSCRLTAGVSGDVQRSQQPCRPTSKEENL